MRVLPGKKRPSIKASSYAASHKRLSLRETYLAGSTNAYRLINAEGDFLPGLIVDRYADYFVCQFFTAGMDLFKEDIVFALSALALTKGIFERSEGRVRDEEGI